MCCCSMLQLYFHDLVIKYFQGWQLGIYNFYEIGRGAVAGALCCHEAVVSQLMTRTGHPQPCATVVDGAYRG